MAKIRGIKPDFWISEQVVTCSMPARLFFIGLWNFSDDHGVFKWKPKMLKMQIFLSDNVSTQKLLKELVDNGFIKKFVFEEAEYGYIINFSKHQRIDKRYLQEIIPNFESSIVENAHESPTSTRRVPDTDGDSEGEGEGDSDGDKEKLKKKKFLNFVFLTSEEKEKLDEQLGKRTTSLYLEKLNNYIGSKGKKYRSHYHTILCWWRKEKEKNSAKKERERALANAPPPKPRKKMRYANPDLIS